MKELYVVKNMKNRVKKVVKKIILFLQDFLYCNVYKVYIF